jgi:hypothetical protein
MIMNMALHSPREESRSRRSLRYPVQNVQGILHFNTEARVINLSLTGLALESPLAVKVGRSYTITLRKGDEPTVRLSATVVWCHLQEIRKTQSGEPQPIYAAGVEFTDTLTEKAGQLIRFLEESAVVTVGRRVTGRFRLEHEQPASVKTAYEFVVKNVSLHGLLLESEFAPQLGMIFDIEVFLPTFTLRTEARVAHAKEARIVDKRTVTEVGMEYVGLGDEDRTRLGSFIASELETTEPPPA